MKQNSVLFGANYFRISDRRLEISKEAKARIGTQIVVGISTLFGELYHADVSQSEQSRRWLDPSGKENHGNRNGPC